MLSDRHTPRLQRNRNFIRPSFAGTSREFAESRFNHKTGIWSAGLSWSHAIPAHGTSWTKVEKCGLIRDFVRISRILCWNRLSANQEYEENEWRFNFAQVENFLSQKNLMFGWIWGGKAVHKTCQLTCYFFISFYGSCTNYGKEINEFERHESFLDAFSLLISDQPVSSLFGSRFRYKLIWKSFTVWYVYCLNASASLLK